MSAGIGIVLAVVCALTVALGFGPVLRRLPPPAGEPGPDYAALARPRFIAATAVAALLAGLVVAWRSPQPWLWCPLVLVLVPACAIDAVTTFLPLRLTQAGWALTALALVGTAAAAHEPATVLRGVVGGSVVGAAFYVAWRLRMVGFGDVRLMLSVAAVAAAVHWGVLVLGLLAGALLGAVCGLVHQLRRRRRGPFPYGPALLAGPFIAVALGG